MQLRTQSLTLFTFCMPLQPGCSCKPLRLLTGYPFPGPACLMLSCAHSHTACLSACLNHPADNRDWELRAAELKERFKQSRAIGERPMLQYAGIQRLRVGLDGSSEGEGVATQGLATQGNDMFPALPAHQTIQPMKRLHAAMGMESATATKSQKQNPTQHLLPRTHAQANI